MANVVAPDVEQLRIADGAASIGEATLAGVAGIRSLVKAHVDLESGVAVLRCWEHIIDKSPEANDARNKAKDIDYTHVGLILPSLCGDV